MICYSMYWGIWRLDKLVKNRTVNILCSKHNIKKLMQIISCVVNKYWTSGSDLIGLSETIYNVNSVMHIFFVTYNLSVLLDVFQIATNWTEFNSSLLGHSAMGLSQALIQVSQALKTCFQTRSRGRRLYFSFWELI